MKAEIANGAANATAAQKSRQILALVIICWIVYFSVNLGRLNLSAAISAIARSEGISRDALGLMASLFFLTYSAGQLLCGIAAERVSPLLLTAAGVALAAAANIIVPWTSSVRIMQVCWAINGIGQAFIWIPLMRILSECLSRKQSVQAALYLNITGPGAAFCIYGLSALFLRFSTWRMIFLFPGIVLFGILLLWLIALPRLLNSFNGAAEERSSEGPSRAIHTAQNHWPLGRLFSAGALGPLIAVSCLHGILKDGFNTWLPAYLVDNFAIHESFSAALAMLLPLTSFAGVYLARRINSRFGDNEVYSTTFLFILLTAILIALWLLTGKLPVSLALFGCAAALLTALNTLLITLVPLCYVHTGRMSTVIGILNTATYLGSGMAGYGFGNAAEYLGWNVTRFSWCVLALAGVILCLGVRKKWNLFRFRAEDAA